MIQESFRLIVLAINSTYDVFIVQLDQSPLSDCANRRASFSNLEDGVHVFSVFFNTSGGVSVASEFRWIIDTVAPTAVVDGGQAFTNGQNVTVNITFSETCDGFICTNASSCDVSCPTSLVATFSNYF